jgi:thioesterase domain-containing protein
MDLTQEQITAFIEKSIAFVQRMGLKALEIGPRRVKLTAPLAGNVNHIGTVYAGALFTLAEMPGGALFLTSFDAARYYPIIKEMTIRFLRPAKTDVTVELTLGEEEVRRITHEADEKGKADYVLEGEIKDAAGEVVAVSRGLYQVRARERKRGQEPFSLAD